MRFTFHVLRGAFASLIHSIDMLFATLVLILCAKEARPQWGIDPKVLLLYDGYANTTLSWQCAEVLRGLSSENGLPQWALQMLDSTGKLSSGVLAGNILSLGDYDQCITIRDAQLGIKGKYCLMAYKMSDDTPLIHGLCIPDVCNVGALVPSRTDHFYVREDFCRTDDVEWDLGDTICTVLLITSLVLTIYATWYDVRKRMHASEDGSPTLLAFSIYSNTLKFCKINPSELSCLYGIRVISTLWIMLGHRASVVGGIPSINSLEMFQDKFSNASNFLYAANFAVDTFFYLSGFLTSYTTFKNGHRMRLGQIPAFIIHRWFRIFPTVAVMFLILITISRRVGSGPFYQLGVENARKPCVDHWFAYLFFFQNYVNYDYLCLSQTWFLSVDMQLHVLSPLLLIPLGSLILSRRIWSIRFLFATLITLSTFVPMMFALQGDNSNLYTTHWRIVIFLIGIYAGSNATRLETLTKKTNNAFHQLIWVLVLVAMAIIAYPSRYLIQEPNTVFAILLAAFGRPIWGLCLTWIIFNCMSGRSESINKFLSLPVFEVLSRLGFSMYALHNLEIGYHAISLRSAIYVDEAYILETWISDIFITMFFSYLWSMIYEVPTIHLDKILFARGTRNGSDKGDVDKTKYQMLEKA